jgi:hypothetical protein
MRSTLVDSKEDKPTPFAHGETVDTLREQAAACRRLSLQSGTKAGAQALRALGNHFDDRAEKLDPLSLRR